MTILDYRPRALDGAEAAEDATTVESTPYRWRAIGASVRGAAHARSGLPNQDAIAWAPADAGAEDGFGEESAGSAALVMAVSDGHGSAKCFRSEIGAQLAVAAALAVARELPLSVAEVTDLATLQIAAEEMVWRWRAAVDADLLAHPISDAELDGVERKAGTGAVRTLERAPWLAYGATLLAVLATDAFVVYFQLGDGDILTVSAEGEVRRPLAGDPRLFADETTSLCARDAVQQFRVGLQLLGEGAAQPPALILLSTDGYANSFRTDAGFVKVGADLLETVRSEGLETVDGCLASWLHEASAFGSGDDVTVGIVCRADVAPTLPPPVPLDEAALDEAALELLTPAAFLEGEELP
jgi:hypothetical protein